MSRCIDADALKEKYTMVTKRYSGGIMECPAVLLESIDSAPTIDAVSVVHGEWIGYNADKGDDWLRSDGEPIFLVCNKCYGTVMNNTSAHWNFCPNCGAKMKGADDEV